MKKVTLAQQLFETAQAVQSVHQGKSLDQALQEVDTELRPGVQALSFHVLRYFALGQALLIKLVKKQPPVQVRTLLWVALTLSATQSDENELLSLTMDVRRNRAGGVIVTRRPAVGKTHGMAL